MIYQIVFFALVSLTMGAPQNLDEQRPMPYSFGYGVNVPETQDQKEHMEVKSETGRTEGMYRWLQPNGFYRVVRYYVDGDSGFVAEVSEEPGPEIENYYTLNGQEQLTAGQNTDGSGLIDVREQGQVQTVQNIQPISPQPQSVRPQSVRPQSVRPQLVQRPQLSRPIQSQNIISNNQVFSSQSSSSNSASSSQQSTSSFQTGQTQRQNNQFGSNAFGSTQSFNRNENQEKSFTNNVNSFASQQSTDFIDGGTINGQVIDGGIINPEALVF